MKATAWVTAAAVLTGTVVLVSQNSWAAADPADAPSSLVEDYSYPGADAIRNDPRNYGLKLFTGDGHLLFVRTRTYDEGQCAAGEIQVEKVLSVAPFGVFHCFRSQGATGFLTLEVPATFGVRGGDKPLEATANLPEGEKTYQVPPNTPVAISPGEGGELPKAVLVELRLT